MMSFLTTLADHPIVVLFLLANLAIGLWAHRKSKVNNFGDYALASRSLPTGVLVMTLLGTYISEIDIFAAGYTFHYGILDSFHLVSHVVPFLLIGTFIAPFLGHFEGCLTLGDLMGKLYGRTVHLISGIVGCLIALFFVSSHVRAIGTMSSMLLGIDPSFAIVCFGGVVVLYSLLGGMRSVSYSDVLQVIAALMVFSWIAQVAIQKGGGIQNIFKYLSKNDPNKLAFYGHPKFIHKMKSIFFWVFSGTYVFTLPLVQRMLITHDKKQVRKVWYTSAIFYTLLSCMVILIGLTAIIWKDEFDLEGKPENVLFHVVQKLFKEQEWILKVLFIGFLGVVLSSMDSFLHSVGISLVQDIIDPIRELSGGAPLSKNRKTVYAKIGIAFIGIFSVIVGFMQGEALFSRQLHQYAVLTSSVIIIPLIIGVLGIKTDRISWFSFCVTHTGITSILNLLRWREHLAHYACYDYFLISQPLAILAYFAPHIYRNGGIVTLKRSEQTVAEQLWIPTWKGAFEYIKSWVLAPFQLHKLAGRKIVNTPTQSLTFSMVIFALYTFSSVMTGGDNDLAVANFMAGIHLIGITLCVGLMLEGIWPDRLKPYFALYWFVTLFYCLPFGGTLTFLRTGSTVGTMLCVGSFVILAFLIDSNSFFVISLLGSGLALASWRFMGKHLPHNIWDSTVLAWVGILVLLVLAVFLFGRSREQHENQRFNWNRTASSALGHDLRTTVSMLGGAGRVLRNTFKIGKPKKDEQGKKGYWLPEVQANFLEDFSETMIQREEMAGKEIQDFSDFIKGQVVGIFGQNKTSMRTAAEEAIRKLKDKAPTIKMTVSGKKDFSPKVLSGVFTNVFYNLLWNAATHGKASDIEVKIDDVTRTVTVWDNGDGIPSDVLPRIFDLNFSTGGKRDKNSGVGLAFVKMVIAASSGKISCHARHGDKDSFTEFVMEFPEV